MDEIKYENFQTLDLRVAKVVKAEEIEGADKLLKLTLEVGDLGERTIAAGIKEFYSPAEMEGRLIIYLSNLAPRELRGVVSQGMLLAVDDGRPYLLTTDSNAAPGSKVR